MSCFGVGTEPPPPPSSSLILFRFKQLQRFDCLLSTPRSCPELSHGLHLLATLQLSFSLVYTLLLLLLLLREMVVVEQCTANKNQSAAYCSIWQSWENRTAARARQEQGRSNLLHRVRLLHDEGLAAALLTQNVSINPAQLLPAGWMLSTAAAAVVVCITKSSDRISTYAYAPSSRRSSTYE